MNETKNITKDSENIGKSKRIFYSDVLRALAMIGIVLCHFSVLYVSRDINSPNPFQCSLTALEIFQSLSL